MEQDEMYARQLAQHYNSGGRPRGHQDDDDRGPPLPSRNNAGRPTLDDGDKEHSFFDGNDCSMLLSESETLTQIPQTICL